MNRYARDWLVTTIDLVTGPFHFSRSLRAYLHRYPRNREGWKEIPLPAAMALIKPERNTADGINQSVWRSLMYGNRCMCRYLYTCVFHLRRNFAHNIANHKYRKLGEIRVTLERWKTSVSFSFIASSAVFLSYPCLMASPLSRELWRFSHRIRCSMYKYLLLKGLVNYFDGRSSSELLGLLNNLTKCLISKR